MILRLLILMFTLAIANYSYSKENDYGGWINYTYIDGDYIFDDFPQIGAYGSIKPTNNTLIAGMVYRDPIYKKGRFGYLFGEFTDSIFDINYQIQGGLLRSDWGLWSNHIINPTTSPLLLQNNAIYSVRYESDVISTLGLNFKLENDKFSLTTFIGKSYALDIDDFAKNTYIQEVEPNFDYQSLYVLILKWFPIEGHEYRLGLSLGDLSDEINFKADRSLLGYKFSKNKWIFSNELQYMIIHGEVNINGFEFINDDYTFVDTFTYLAYDFKRFRLYGVFSTTYKEDGFGDYMTYATVSNSFRNQTALPPLDMLTFELLNANINTSKSLAVGVVFDVNESTTIRFEVTYMKTKGFERLLNNDSKFIRDEYSGYLGLSVTHLF